VLNLPPNPFCVDLPGWMKGSFIRGRFDQDNLALRVSLGQLSVTAFIGNSTGPAQIG